MENDLLLLTLFGAHFKLVPIYAAPLSPSDFQLFAAGLESGQTHYSYKTVSRSLIDRDVTTSI